jgi:probable H4MPT-linked C1 transfer pathway protein
MSLPAPVSWLGLDIGGANLKAAHTSGRALSVPFEVWKRPGELAPQLARIGAQLPPADRVAVTMTAELCDCFATKSEGVSAILGAVEAAFPGREAVVWGHDQRFHPPRHARARPDLVASANWLALAALAARLAPEGPGLLIDVGSTTADLIPLKDGQAAPAGRNDLARLRSGELVYAGVRRTPVMALATELPFRGMPTGLAAELFASTLDIYLTLGEIPPDPADDSTADGRPATVEAAADRLARMVLSDRSDFSADDALAFAKAADEVLVDRLARAALRACEATVGAPRSVIVSGSGSFLARRVATRVMPDGGPILDLEASWGPERSSAACAHAVLVLASEAGQS